MRGQLSLTLKTWKQIKGSVVWGDFFDTRNEALKQAKTLSL